MHKANQRTNLSWMIPKGYIGLPWVNQKLHTWLTKTQTGQHLSKLLETIDVEQEKTMNPLRLDNSVPGRCLGKLLNWII